MCDYSLNISQSRLAEDGQQLVLQRFGAHTLGFASLEDLQHHGRTQKRGFWAALKQQLLGQAADDVPAICVPPGSRLLLTDIPAGVQKAVQMNPSETVVFHELPGPVPSYRDALELPNGTLVLLQDLVEGIHAFVVSTSVDSDLGSEIDELEKVYLH